ncbi:MAG: molybdopterin-guanine dinucleotide biosynthesis protein B [SAR202 cluster bacterium]|nr:molybdopterin-guanine dinucleotide biosynthesis protein B [SAR202 cluster bacterium]
MISIVGYSGSGKTHLIRKIIKRLSNKGFLLIAVKNTHHKTLESPLNKDSEMMYKEGAQSVIAVSDEDLIIRSKHNYRPRFDELISQVARSTDLVICEGIRDPDLPKIWVGDEMPTDGSIQNLVATVDNKQSGQDAGVLRFSSDDVDQISHFIVSNFVRYQRLADVMKNAAKS